MIGKQEEMLTGKWERGKVGQGELLSNCEENMLSFRWHQLFHELRLASLIQIGYSLSFSCHYDNMFTNAIQEEALPRFIGIAISGHVDQAILVYWMIFPIIQRRV